MLCTQDWYFWMSALWSFTIVSASLSCAYLSRCKLIKDFKSRTRICPLKMGHLYSHENLPLIRTILVSGWHCDEPRLRIQHRAQDSVSNWPRNPGPRYWRDFHNQSYFLYGWSGWVWVTQIKDTISLYLIPNGGQLTTILFLHWKQSIH